MLEDFPYSDSCDALKHLRSIFNKNLEDLESLSPETDPKIVNTLCISISKNINCLFDLLGFIIRSTDVRNSFELHGPFLRIIRKLLGNDSKLIISSEWNYSPFTFLIPAEYQLKDTVMIGVPASESENCLTIPLSGHELGHNIWSHASLSSSFGPKIEDAIKEVILHDYWDEFQSFEPLVNRENFDDLIGRQVWSQAWDWSLRQCEELFCDFVGISLFRESFLYSFSYLLSPGASLQRSPYYPSLQDRAKHQESACAIIGVKVPDGYHDSFQEIAKTKNPYFELMLNISDAATGNLIDKLVEIANKLILEAGINPPEEAEIEKINRCFGLCVPPLDFSGLPAVVNAAWEFYRGGMKEWRQLYPDLTNSPLQALNALSQLVFKSIEVHEINYLQRSEI